MVINEENEILASLRPLNRMNSEPHRPEVSELTGGCASDVISDALDRYKNVEVPYVSEVLYLKKPIVMGSGTRLTVHKDTVIRMESGCGGCMLRNANPVNGMERASSAGTDRDIVVEGGIWDGSVRSLSPYDGHPVFRTFREKNLILGVLFFSGVYNLIIRNMTISDGDQYAVLLAGCSCFEVGNLFFDRYKKDGLHINGPSSYGLVRGLKGTTGDDFIALNAWDWCSSSVSFGPIHHIFVRDLSCVHDEIRLLPGRKTYPDGSKTDCEISSCSFSRMTGIYNVKMYQQPNCHNKSLGISDRSEIAGVLKDIHFSDLDLTRIETEGVGEVRISALFEICADCENIVIENINISETEAEYLGRGMHLTDVGPKSSVWTQGDPDPEKWTELFDPDLICTVKNISFKNIRFAGKKCRDIATLAHAHRLLLSEEYPLPVPGGKTGYGMIENALSD